MRPRLGTICAALALCAVLVAGAQAAPVASIRPSFAPNRLGASAAFTLTVNYSEPPRKVPTAIRQAVVHLPAGLEIDLRGIGVCPQARIVAHGGRGCPASSRIGSGSALLGAHLGSQDIDEAANLMAYRDSSQGFAIVGHGLSPLDERVVLNALVRLDDAPYGLEVAMTIPPIPTLPTEPYASTLRFSLTLRSSRHGRRLIRVPTRCPAGGFPFAANFAYADGGHSFDTVTMPCP